ncbi:MAG: ATP-dependent chaperone ClpB, partial [Chloroflexota bacterium]
LADRRLTLELTQAAKQFLAEEGFDPVFGARPLKRTMQRLLQDPLAIALLEGQVQDGEHVLADVAPDGGGLSFEIVMQAEIVE